MSKVSPMKFFILFIVLMVVCTSLGQILSDFMIAKHNHVPFSFNLFFESFSLLKNGEVKELGLHNIIMIVIAIGLTIAPIPIVLFLIITQNKRGLFGDSRFANDLDLAASGLLEKKKEKNPGILLGQVTKGRFKKKYPIVEASLHSVCYAPTRSGKGISIVLSNIIYNATVSSMCVNDMKLENFCKTAAYLKSKGQEVFVFAPDNNFSDCCL